MSNLPNNTTIDGKKIISESDSNEHRHDSAQIIGLSESAIGDTFVYAEFIDGVSYSQMQSNFISDTNNSMTGTLNISTNSNNEDNIINVFELEALKTTNGIIGYDISDIPPVEETNTAVQSIMVTGSNPSVDLTWTPSSVSSTTSSISMTGPEQVSSGNSYQFTIKNYSRFDIYSVTVDIGSVSFDTVNGIINYTSPSTAPYSNTVNMTVENTTISVSKEISFTLLQDADITLSYYNGSTYEPLTGPLVFDDNQPIDVRIDNYNPNYTYQLNYNTSVLSITQSGDILTITPPNLNQSPSTETVTISREGDSLAFNVALEEYNFIDLQNKTYIITAQSQTSEFTSPLQGILRAYNKDGIQVDTYNFSDGHSYYPYDINKNGVFFVRGQELDSVSDEYVYKTHKFTFDFTTETINFVQTVDIGTRFLGVKNDVHGNFYTTDTNANITYRDENFNIIWSVSHNDLGLVGEYTTNIVKENITANTRYCFIIKEPVLTPSTYYPPVLYRFDRTDGSFTSKTITVNDSANILNNEINFVKIQANKDQVCVVCNAETPSVGNIYSIGFVFDEDLSLIEQEPIPIHTIQPNVVSSSSLTNGDIDFTSYESTTQIVTSPFATIYYQVDDTSIPYNTLSSNSVTLFNNNRAFTSRWTSSGNPPSAGFFMTDLYGNAIVSYSYESVRGTYGNRIEMCAGPVSNIHSAT